MSSPKKSNKKATNPSAVCPQSSTRQLMQHLLYGPTQEAIEVDSEESGSEANIPTNRPFRRIVRVHFVKAYTGVSIKSREEAITLALE